ncbi:MAG TPA: biotin--[acetyl-CoA-carboxylase] ligase [Thermoanaerobaculia bacterium]|nr:biotin--[acetyl-CoA-carboxylase] ligase [Thermoanaerobaculia bacterium]
MDFDHYVEGLERRRDRRGPENLVVLPRLPSTNALARAIIAEYQNEAQTLQPLLLLTLEQSGGRGRRGRSWSSPRGKGVYATRVATVADPAFLQTLPLLVGVGLCRSLSPHLPSPCRLKWPNDLLVEVAGERKKIGGVLIEAAVRPGEEALAIVGFGVNYLHGAADLPETATSLVLLGGGVVSLVDLTWDLVEGVEAELTHLGDAAYAVRSYRALSIHRPGERIACRVGESVLEGTFQGFDESGRLLMESGGQAISVAAGEVIEG